MRWVRRSGRYFRDYAEASISGIMTGILLAIARVLPGKRRHCCFTALSNQFWSTDMMQPIANLPVTIFQIRDEPVCRMATEQLWGAGAC